eukprot:gene3569-4073_t
MAGLELISPEGLRMDGRKPDELRRLVCKVGVYQQPDGSAVVEHGNTKAIASVYGPHEAVNAAKSKHDKAVVNCQYSMATFSTNERKNRPKGDRRSTEMALTIEKIFDSAILTSLFPKSQIDIYMEVIQSDGGNLAACINAATLALINAGIPVRDYVSACTSTFVDETPLIDANSLEENSGTPNLTLALLPKSDSIVLFQMDSRLHMDSLQTIIEDTRKGCSDIATILQRTIKNNIAEHAATLVI